MRKLKSFIRSLIPASILEPLLYCYHFSLAWFASIMYGAPSEKLRVIAVTGTKGKSSTVEMVSAIFEAAGEKTALANSIRFKIGDTSEPNLTRMSMLGRFFLQGFLDQAVREGCTTAVLEMTSEGSRQARHRFIELDALIFTNLAPEHLESHGSYEAYADAKFEIGRQLARSKKRPRIIVANADDAESSRYLTLPVEYALPFSLSTVQPYAADERGGYFTFDGLQIPVHIAGEFSLKNALAAATVARACGVKPPEIAAGLEALKVTPGRAERVEAGQNFDVVVDYAHTPDSLQALYDAYAARRKICVLGSTGGGRDTWKRPVMGGVADKNCDVVILTNEDPYDEDPEMIVRQIAKGCARPPTVIMNRREAIAHAISLAHEGDAVLITGKGTDPNIALSHGKKLPWSDTSVAREELNRLKQ